MAGIYIHIPFCKQACHYCDFHFSTNTSMQAQLLQAIGNELTMQKHYLGEEKINTVYFGGGTPSMLLTAEVNNILSYHFQKFRCRAIGGNHLRSQSG